MEQNDAEDVQTKAQRYDLIETALLDGDVFSALEQLNGKHTSKSVTRLVDTFLPSLMAASKDLYSRATRPVFGDWLATVYRDAEATGDRRLMDAAYALATHVFETDEQRQAAENYRRFNREVMEHAYSRLETVVFDSIEDPDGRLTPFTRKAIGNVTLSELDRRLEEDPQLAATLEVLGERARDGGFTDAHREAIVGAHVSRARAFLPGILKRVTAEALGHPGAPTATVRPTEWHLGQDAAFHNATKH